MKRMLKILSLFMITMFITLQMAGCGPGEKDAAVEHMLTVWYDYLSVLDKMYASELWALDYTDAYLDTGDWQELARARTACIASARYLKELSMTKENLSEEEYQILADAKIDIGYQKEELLSLSDDLEEAHTLVREVFLDGLEGDVYDKDLVKFLQEEMAVHRECISLMRRYTCNETNYLLVTLGNGAEGKKEWTVLQEKYPVLFSECGEWLQTEAEIKLRGDTCLVKYEDTLFSQADLISMRQAHLYRWEQIIQANDLKAVIDAANPMSHLPALLPLPIWYEPADAKYLSFINGGGGSVTYPKSGDDLANEKYSVYLQVENVTAEDIKSYAGLAEHYACRIWKDQERDIWYMEMPGYNVSMECKGDTVTIIFDGEDITFAPGWYIDLQ